MRVAAPPIMIQPTPLPRIPIGIMPSHGNGGIVPPWLQRPSAPPVASHQG